MKKPIIELRNVWKIYPMGNTKVNALQGLNLKVHEGEFLAVQGPSGSGKSTAMHLIGCLDIPSKGEIYLDSKNISQLDESTLAQIRGRKIGFIFQQFNLIETLTALENVILPMTFQGIEEEVRKQKAGQLLKMLGLGDRTNHKPKELSGGQQQRVAIARSLAVDPPVILADEPTGNLDTKTGKEVMASLHKLHKQGKTIILVTHDSSIAKTADRVEFLQDGKIIKSTRYKK